HRGNRMIQRRSFITLLGGAAAWPLAAGAQQGGRVRRIGGLLPFDEKEPRGETFVPALMQELAGLGLAGGRNVWDDVRRGGTDINRARALAHELIGLKPDIIVTNTTPATVAVQRDVRTIPIVFSAVSDPVASGIVTRLDRPGGNITGFALNEASLGAK